MAHLTNNAVDSLLGFLTKAVKDEARLLSGVEGDIQFIQDEMDSMNGFLRYLTKTKTPHDDQVRAWMKQVRDLAYMADDFVKLYRRDLTPPEPGFWPWLRHVPTLLSTVSTRHRLAKKIHELKERVREVAKRRQRYDVTVPRHEGGDVIDDEPSADEKTSKLLEAAPRALEAALRALEDDLQATPLKGVYAPIKRLLSVASGATPLNNFAAQAIRNGPDHAASAKMLLRAYYANPNRITEDEVKGLFDKLKGERSGADVPDSVIVFCYSKLSTHQKSCLQYLTTFGEEESISRTCLIRRWLAEGTVARVKDVESMEVAGERCFDELVLRGFISPAPVPTTGLKIKSCIVDPSVKKFISSISRSDNFIDDLPTHLRNQIDIRKLAQRKPPQPQHKPWWWCPPPTCITTICGHDDDDGKLLPPMDEMVKLLKRLPEEYRLNVLDLGGCTSLKMSHLTTICELVPSLKYLSLRKTNVFWLPKQMNNLLHLETLDIRDTRVQANAMRRIFHQELKHLLAGAGGHITGDAEPLSTVKIPNKIGKNTEILKHVQINDGRRKAQVELRHVGSLERLRKLGVVLNGSQDNMEHLLRAIAMRSEFLRSLSVWITEPPPGDMAAGHGDSRFVTVDTSGGGGAPLFPRPEKLQSLNLKCFRGNSTRGHIPQWIKGLHFLSKITLRYSLLTQDGLSELGKLKNLRCLRLCHESYIEAKVTLKDKEFQELRFLLLDHVSNNTRELSFQAGAAPNLEKIVWNLNSSSAGRITADNISGFENCPRGLELIINGDPYRHSK